MEFKLYFNGVPFADTPILIESQWNLNTLKLSRIRHFAGILIESQWNLNVEVIDINSVLLFILIESQWNLNSNADTMKLKTLPILIESQWNLNYLIKHLISDTFSDINRITVEFKSNCFIRASYLPFNINRITVEFK